MLGHVWMQTENTARCQWEFFLKAKRTHRGGDLKEKRQKSRGDTTGIQVVPGGLGMLILGIPKTLLFLHTMQLAPRCAHIQDPWSRVTGHREAESVNLCVVIAGSNKRLIFKN